MREPERGSAPGRMARCVIILSGLAALAACSSQTAEPEPRPVTPTPPQITAPQQTLPGSVDYLRVDKSARTLTLYSAGKYVKTIDGLQFGDRPYGHKQFEGDERTPEGRYFIDARNPQSSYHLSLRISYPNVADARRAESLGRSPGGDIFLHGQPNALPTGRVPGDWTDGCIALSNAQIAELWQLVPDGAIIDIYP